MAIGGRHGRIRDIRSLAKRVFERYLAYRRWHRATIGFAQRDALSDSRARTRLRPAATANHRQEPSAPLEPGIFTVQRDRRRGARHDGWRSTGRAGLRSGARARLHGRPPEAAAGGAAPERAIRPRRRIAGHAASDRIGGTPGRLESPRRHGATRPVEGTLVAVYLKYEAAFWDAGTARVTRRSSARPIQLTRRSPSLIPLNTSCGEP